MTETSFTWNFDAGTLTDDAVKSLQDVQCGSGYGLPLAACLPGSDEPDVASTGSSQRTPAQLGSEHQKLLSDISDKVIHVTV